MKTGLEQVKNRFNTGLESSRGGLKRKGVNYSFSRRASCVWWIESRLGPRFIYKVESLNKKEI